MNLIEKMVFNGKSKEAIDFYKEVFHCEIKSLILYKDAVANGWEPECPDKNEEIYHSEILFGDKEVRFSDSDGDEYKYCSMIEHLVGFDSDEEVDRVFKLLSVDGEVLQPLERPPYMVIIGSVRDKFGIHWTLMCDFK